MKGRSMLRNARAQSAMEYLITYGWAILLIAIVVSALFMLGAFNYNGFTQKALPGSCSVLRPHGPGTTVLIQMTGLCTGLLPQSVAQFNGNNGYIFVSNSRGLDGGMTQLTMTAWVKANAFYPAENIIHDESAYTLSTSGNNQLSFNIANNGGTWDYGLSYVLPQPMVLGTWYFVSATWNGIDMVVYFNGQKSTPLSTISNAINVVSGPFDIGVWGSWEVCQRCIIWNGSIANVQFYNTSLSQAEITSLYQDGIGAAPIKIHNLVGWWPLNGNANDYGGNNNNGTATAIQYITNWQDGYSILP